MPNIKDILKDLTNRFKDHSEVSKDRVDNMKKVAEAAAKVASEAKSEKEK